MNADQTTGHVDDIAVTWNCTAVPSCSWYAYLTIGYRADYCDYRDPAVWTSPTQNPGGNDIPATTRSGALNFTLAPHDPAEFVVVCVWVKDYYGGTFHLADANDQLKPPPPSPPDSPPVTPPAPSLITEAEAERISADALADQYGWRWIQGVRKRNACKLHSTTYRCKVSWTYKRKSFRGTTSVVGVVGDTSPVTVKVRASKRSRKK